MIFTKQGSDYNEVEVLKLINTYPNTKMEKSKKNYSAFDLHGFIDNTPTLLEVKERRQFWNKMWLEEDKFLSIFAKAKRYNGTVNCYLVISVKDQHLMYDMKDLWRYGTRKTEEMNHQTAESFQHSGYKKNKRIIEFKKDSFMINLTTGEIGDTYEIL